MAQYLPSLSRSCKGFALLAASGLLAGGAWVRARAQSAELTAQKDLQVEENQAAEAAATDKFSSTRENINDAQGQPIAKVKVTLPPPPKNWALKSFPSGNVADLVSHPGGMVSADTKKLEFLMNPPSRADKWLFGLEGNLRWAGPVGNGGGGGGGGKDPKAAWGGIACQSNVDLDVDSDNTKGRGGAPDRTDAEDGVEMTAPGKYVEVNDDTGDDRIPGFAKMTGGHFTPLVLEISSDVDVSKATLELTYPASDPANAATADANGLYTPAAGKLRLWKSPASGAGRKPASVNSDGDFVPSGAVTLDKIGLSVTNRSVTLLMEGIRPSAAAGDVKITMKLDPDGAGPAAEVKDEVVVTTYKVDLDVDSDNKDGIDDAEFCLEDQIEDDSKKPGAFVGVNDGDRDEDGIPDFADGFDRDGASGTAAEKADDASTGVKFTKMKLRVSKAVDLTKAKFKVEAYGQSDPAGVAVSGTAPDRVYTPATGKLRLWKKDGDQSRKKESIASSGDFIPAGEYTATQLGLTATTAGAEVELFIEGVRPGAAAGDLPIKIKVLPTGVEASGGFAEDGVRVTAVGVDLDVDSDNDDKYASPKRTDLEDVIEAKKDRPGKILELNVLDRDYDGVPDFADGYDIEHTAGTSESGADKSYEFTPMILELKEPIDLAKAQIKFTYSASDPATIARTGTGIKTDPYVYAADAAGKLRIWTKDGPEAREKASVEDGGNYVPTGVKVDADALDDLGTGRILKLYVEAVAGSATAGDLDIKVEVDPDGDEGPAGFIVADIVKVTVVKVEAVHPLDVDFAAGKGGRVVISTNTNDPRPNRWHTNAKTTADDKAAQTKDAEVVISAYVTPKLKDVDVYFEVIDPDDLSPYEGKTTPGLTTAARPEDENPNDNRDPAKRMTGLPATEAVHDTYQNACLSVRTAKTQLKTINGVQQAVAETTLKITNRYSGDNYRVRAVCRNPQTKPFDANSGTTSVTSTGANPVSGIAPVSNPLIAQSAVLVAWKRIYLEYDQMYKKGGTLTAVPGVLGLNTTLPLDNAADFAIGDVIIFDNAGVTRERKVLAVAGNTLTVLPLDVAFAKYSGVKLKGDNTVYDASRGGLERGYGANTEGTDSGCFVEFLENITPGGGNIPKYTNISSADWTNYSRYWGKLTRDGTNIIHLIAAEKAIYGSPPVSILGLTLHTENWSYIFCGETDGTSVQNARDEDTVAHEIGHQFQVNNTHVDSNTVTELNHEGTDGCIMTYTGTNDTDGIIEFDFDCLKDVRDAEEKR